MKIRSFFEKRCYYPKDPVDEPGISFSWHRLLRRTLVLLNGEWAIHYCPFSFPTMK